MSYALTPPETVSVPVRGTDQCFPVRNIYCVGRNYWAHRAEMGVTDRDPPFYFTKTRDAIVYCPAGETVDLPYPPMTANYHHEIELVVAIGTEGANIAEENAENHVFGYAIGLDMTRRDLQSLAKEKGRPWDNGKSFAAAGPMGAIVPASECGHIASGRIWLSVNGETRQDGQMDEMIFNVQETIADLSRFHTLLPGDLIFTGTPAGVGAVSPGDVITGGADGVGELSVRVTST